MAFKVIGFVRVIESEVELELASPDHCVKTSRDARLVTLLGDVAAIVTVLFGSYHPPVDTTPLFGRTVRRYCGLYRACRLISELTFSCRGFWLLPSDQPLNA